MVVDDNKDAGCPLGSLLRIFVGHTDTINIVGTSPDEQWLATGSSDRSAMLWNRGGTRVCR